MKLESVIDFNKYTLALAAGGFIYVLEKLTPLESGWIGYFVIGLQVILLLSVILGILIFGAATSGLGADENTGTRKTVETFITWAGVTHAILLTAGMFMLGFILFRHVVYGPSSPTVEQCCKLCS